MYLRSGIILLILVAVIVFWRGHRDPVPSSSSIEVSANSLATAASAPAQTLQTEATESTTPPTIATHAPARALPSSNAGDASAAANAQRTTTTTRPEKPVHFNDIAEEKLLVHRLSEIEQSSYADLLDDSPGIRTEQGYDQYNYFDAAEGEQLTQWKKGDDILVEEFIDADGNTIVRRYPNIVDGTDSYQTTFKDTGGAERGLEKDRNGKVTSTWTTKDGKTVTNYYDENGMLTETVESR